MDNLEESYGTSYRIMNNLSESCEIMWNIAESKRILQKHSNIVSSKSLSEVECAVWSVPFAFKAVLAEH